MQESSSLLLLILLQRCPRVVRLDHCVYLSLNVPELLKWIQCRVHLVPKPDYHRHSIYVVQHLHCLPWILQRPQGSGR